MRVVAIVNSRAGRGGALALAERLVRSLRGAGHEPLVLQAGAETDAVLAERLRGAGALVVAGGDGTLHHAAEHAAACDVPVYHLPLGTENLFARQFGMDLDLERLTRALAQGRTTSIDLGRCNGRLFVLMCSVGPDASVVHRVARNRRKAIGHLAYVVPSLMEFAWPRLAPLTIRADGEEVVRARPGLAVIANSRQYALRLDPAPSASMTDGRLDLAFFPCDFSVQVLAWGLATRLRRQGSLRAFVARRAASFEIETAGPPAPYQVDGESPESVGAAWATTPLCVRVEPARLRVLLPAHA